MNSAAISRAISEAQRFIRAAQAAEQRLKSDKYALITGSRETASCRRASMDLTRTLADLRQGR